MQRHDIETLFRYFFCMVWPIMSGAATQGTMFGVLRRQSQRTQSQRKAPHSPLITSEASFADSILPLREW
jgi:hypothetical protein